jgi:DMSO reductase anchor subunit
VSANGRRHLDSVLHLIFISQVFFRPEIKSINSSITSSALSLSLFDFLSFLDDVVLSLSLCVCVFFFVLFLCPQVFLLSVAVRVLKSSPDI